MSGWRPIGEPKIDSFGYIRRSLLAYEKRLLDKRARLNKGLEVLHLPFFPPNNDLRIALALKLLISIFTRS